MQRNNFLHLSLILITYSALLCSTLLCDPKNQGGGVKKPCIYRALCVNTCNESSNNEPNEPVIRDIISIASTNNNSKSL